MNVVVSFTVLLKGTVTARARCFDLASYYRWIWCMSEKSGDAKPQCKPKIPTLCNFKPFRNYKKAREVKILTCSNL